MSNVVCNVCCEWYEGMCGYVVLSYKVVDGCFRFYQKVFMYALCSVLVSPSMFV